MFVQEAHTKDLEHLLPLFRQHYKDVPQSSDPALPAFWQELLDDDSHRFFVGLVKDQIVSYCALALFGNTVFRQKPYAIITDIITLKAHQRRGYASKLLLHTKKFAMQEHLSKLILLPEASEDAAQKLCNAAGFKQSSGHIFTQYLK